MCIYLTKAKNLHYDSADHIMPAGLGGIKKLPLNYVSREFNTLSSKLEQSLMRESIVSMPRQILGPGKRGSLNPNKATKSPINVFRQNPNNGTFSLGYIQKGKPFEIPHIVFNSTTGQFTVGLNKNSTDSDIQMFKQHLMQFEELKIKIIKFKHLDPNTYLIGFPTRIDENFECFIASKDGVNHPFNKRMLEQISSLIKDRGTFASSKTYNIRTNQNVVINEDYYRCCAKIAFNCLAHLKGKSFVTREIFDPIRNWIVNGGQNNFVTITPNYNKIINKIFPEDSHQVIITKSGNELIGDICFYNHFHNLVRFSDSYDDLFSLDGFICDWKAKIEFNFIDFLTQYWISVQNQI